MKLACKNNPRSAFTLIELMVVMSIISMLASTVMVGVNSARAKAQIAAGLLFASNIYHRYGGSDLIGRWAFDEASGNALDSSPNTRTMVTDDSSPIVRSTTNTPSGQGKSLDTNDGDTFYNTNQFTNQSFSDYTMSTWLYLNSLPSYDVVIGSLNRYTDGSFGIPMSMYYDSWYGISCYSGNFSPNLKVNAGLQAISTGKWYYVACSLNRTTGKLALYINGRKIIEGSGTPSALVPFSQILIGNDHGSQFSGDFGSFDGYVDDFSVYSQAIN